MANIDLRHLIASKTIEAIWSGKGYRWDPRTREFEAIK